MLTGIGSNSLRPVRLAERMDNQYEQELVLTTAKGCPVAIKANRGIAIGVTGHAKHLTPLRTKDTILDTETERRQIACGDVTSRTRSQAI